MKKLFFGFLSGAIIFFTGCMPHRTSSALGAAIVESMVAAPLEPSLTLAVGALRFREETKRWPRDYQELSGYLKERNQQTFNQLQSVHCDRINVKENPDGTLEITCDYSIANQDSSPAPGIKVHIEQMHVKSSQTLSPDSCVPK